MENLWSESLCLNLLKVLNWLNNVYVKQPVISQIVFQWKIFKVIMIKLMNWSDMTEVGCVTSYSLAFICLLLPVGIYGYSMYIKLNDICLSIER